MMIFTPQGGPHRYKVSYPLKAETRGESHMTGTASVLKMTFRGQKSWVSIATSHRNSSRDNIRVGT